MPAYWAETQLLSKRTWVLPSSPLEAAKFFCSWKVVIEFYILLSHHSLQTQWWQLALKAQRKEVTSLNTFLFQRVSRKGRWREGGRSHIDCGHAAHTVWSVDWNAWNLSPEIWKIFIRASLCWAGLLLLE